MNRHKHNAANAVSCSIIYSNFFFTIYVKGTFFSIRRSHPFREYAVGNKQYSTTTLVTTVLASYYGGGVLMSSMTGFSEDYTD